MMDEGISMTMDEPPEWQDIARRLRPFLLNKLRSAQDADDALQNALLRIHRGLPGLRRRERLVPWMYRIAQNAAADQLRERRRHRVHGGLESEAPSDPEEDQSTARALARFVAELVRELDEPYKSALELTELRGLTHQAAAEAQGISLTAMKSRVQRGREKLRRELERCCSIALDARRRVIHCEPRKTNRCC